MVNRVRIGIVSKTLFNADTRLMQQAYLLAVSGFAVDVVCRTGTAEKKMERHGSITVYGIGSKTSKLGFGTYLGDTLHFFIKTLFLLRRLSSQRAFKALVIHTLPEFLVFLGIFQKIAGAKIILDARDLTVELLGSRWGSAKMKFVKRCAVLVERMACSFSDFVITASDGFRERLLSRGVPYGKVQVIMNTADGSIFKFQKDRRFSRITKQGRFLYHGTVSPRFGVIKAVEAMPAILEKIPESVFTVYGQYVAEYKAAIERVIETHHLHSSVILNDIIPLQEIYSVILKTDIGIVPYLSDEFMNMALSTKTFEYVASGLPVIVSRLRSITALFNDQCILFSEPGNSGDIARRVIEFCLNPSLRRTMVFQAAKSYEAISGDVMGKRYMDVINRVLWKHDASGRRLADPGKDTGSP